jgi:CubicO group peptidase (beta-lactamase class C family)
MRPLPILLSLAVTTVALGAQSPARAPDFAEAKRLLRDEMAKDTTFAAAIAVVRDGAIIFEEGFGWADPATRRAATPTTPFSLASLAKTFEATLAVVLHEQHRLGLVKPVNDYL